MEEIIQHPCVRCQDFVTCTQTEKPGEEHCQKYQEWLTVSALVRSEYRPPWPRVVACKSLGNGPKSAVHADTPYECKEGEHIVIFDDGVYVVSDKSPRWKKMS